jgi:hypothetical protein
MEYIDTMDEARANVDALSNILEPELIAQVLVETTRNMFKPGSFARYLCMAAWREKLAG